LIANSTAAHGTHLVSEGGQSLWLNNQYRSVEAYSYTSAVASPQSENKDISGSVQIRHGVMLILDRHDVTIIYEAKLMRQTL